MEEGLQGGSGGGDHREIQFEDRPYPHHVDVPEHIVRAVDHVVEVVSSDDAGDDNAGGGIWC